MTIVPLFVVLIRLMVPGAYKFILGGAMIVGGGMIVPVCGAGLMLMLRLGGFNVGGGFDIFMLGIGARIIGLICGGCNGYAFTSRLVGTLIGGGFEGVKP